MDNCQEVRKNNLQYILFCCCSCLKIVNNMATTTRGIHKLFVIVVFVNIFITLVQGSCKDLDSRCDFWTKRGECNKNVEFMRKNCPMSCKFCDEAIWNDVLVNAQQQVYYAVSFLVMAVIALLIIGVKVYFAGGSCSSPAKLKGKTVIVTGANSGIGREAALSFAGRGAKVILACRSYGKGLKAMKYIRDLSENKLVEFRKLDLSSFNSIREFAEEFNKEEDRLDILVNNAGVLTTSARQMTKDGHEEMFQVNHLGPFLLTNLLLDKLKKSSPSRIINVSSKLHHSVKEVAFQDLEMASKFNRFKQLAMTKLENILFTRELSKRLEGTGVTVNALHPGYVVTNATNNVGVLQWKLVKLLTFPIKFIFFKSARQGAQTTIRLAVDPELENVTGKYFADCELDDVSDAAKDDGAAKKLWEISERLTKIRA